LIRRLACLVALVLIALALLTASGTSAEHSSGSSPDFTLNIPASFGTNVTVKHYRKGEDILNSPPFRLITTAPMMEHYARYRAGTSDHVWGVRVYAALSKKVIAAYATARDGFEADLNEEPELLKGLNEPSHVFARFERKHFRWGNAVSFLSTKYQDTPDHEFYVPDNDHLKYEVWGVTRNRQ